MVDLPAEFVARMRDELGEESDKFFESYKSSAEKGIRVNTLKISVEDFYKISPFPVSPVEWEPRGFYVEEQFPGKTPLHAAGLYYVQEPSAMYPAPRLAVKPGERVLDLCSAPGGKGTALAQDMCGEGVLVLNEINFSRAKILSSNVERLGIRNAAVTCAPPEALVRQFENYFDKILVDAPCSGEGMFRKDPLAVCEWNLKSVYACADRQKAILVSADKMLAEGGVLVYSTCTFSAEEDEKQVQNFLSAHKNYTLEQSVKLYPHRVRGEGHFCAVLKKTGGEKSYPRPFELSVNKKLLSAYREWERENIKPRFSALHSVGQTLYSVPEDMPQISVQTMRMGVRLGELRGDRFVPDHALAMALTSGDCAAVEVGEEDAIKYLRGETIGCAAEGWAAVSYLGHNLGWCKGVGGIAKNHLPKGLRI